MNFNISNIQRIAFRDDLVVLRAFAVLSVVLYHAELKIFKGGWLGVDIFFVISGYLISNIIISEINSGQFKFSMFYLRRIRRILPALFSTLVLSIPFSYWLLNPKELIEYCKSLISSLFFYSNYYFQNLDFYNSPSAKFMPLLHTWSLSVEEQFYILFPVSIFLVFKYQKKYLLHLLFLSTIFSIYLNSHGSELTKFYQIQFRLWEFLSGVMIMIFSSKLKFKNFEKFGIVILIFTVVYFDDSWISSIEGKIFAVIGSLFILMSDNDFSILEKFSSNKFIYRIGIISYSLYLLHQPIFSFTRNYLSNNLLEETLLIKFSLIIISMVLANFQYEFIEKKFSNIRIISSLNMKYSSALILLIFLYSLQIFQTNGAIYRFENNEFLQKYYTDAQRSTVSESNCVDGSLMPCLILNNNLTEKNIIIIGDSHLDTLSNFLYNSSKKYNYNLVISNNNGCPYALIYDPVNRDTCYKSYEEGVVLDYINKDSIVIYGGRFPRYLNGVDFSTNLGSIEDDLDEKNLVLEDIGLNIDYFVKNAKVLILIYPIPELGLYPLEYYLYDYLNDNEFLGYEKKYWDEYSSIINQKFDNYTQSNIFKIKTNEYFCDSYVEDTCVASYGETMFYWDDDHLSYDGASVIGKDILEIILRY